VQTPGAAIDTVANRGDCDLSKTSNILHNGPSEDQTFEPATAVSKAVACLLSGRIRFVDRSILLVMFQPM
jgi:hypothetical protein